MWEVKLQADAPVIPTTWTMMAMLYGDYPDLASRCLDSWEFLPRTMRRIVLCNHVGATTRSYVQRLYDRQRLDVVYFAHSDREKQPKYPYMRAAIHDAAVYQTSRYLMWFDDDSYVRPGVHPGNGDWILRALEALIQLPNTVMVGSTYTIKFPAAQRNWVARQPWAQNPKTRSHHVPREIKFATGGWWCAHTEFLSRIDYPWKNLVHNGGDTMLGECCRRHGVLQASLPRDNIWFAINADDGGRESQALRRGRDDPPIGTKPQ